MKNLLLNVIILTLWSFSANGQNENNYYKYSQLSSIQYKNYRDSLKKYWECPNVFKNKSTQKEYESYWSERSGSLTKAIDNNDFIKDSILYPYLFQLTTELTKASPDLFPYPVFLLLDRSNIPNAYAIGEHIIAINAGLVMAAKSKEELSFYIAHELSHDLLRHTDNSMQQRAELVTSDDYKASLKNVLSSKYERYTRLKKIFESHSFDRRRHSRYNESEADSMAIVLMEKAGIPFDATFFLNLDTADNIYKQNLRMPATKHMEQMGLTWVVPSTSIKKGLSGKTISFKDTASNSDSLKTHPDCTERYQKTLSKNSKISNKTALPNKVYTQATYIAMVDMFINRNICHGMYRILQSKEMLSSQLPYDFLLDINMKSLLYASKQMDRFNTLRIQRKQDVCTTYFDFQELLSKIPETELENYCAKRKKMTQNYSKEQIAFLDYLEMLLSASVSSEFQKSIRKVAAEYKVNFPESPYIEHMTDFINKR